MKLRMIQGVVSMPIKVQWNSWIQEIIQDNILLSFILLQVIKVME